MHFLLFLCHSLPSPLLLLLYFPPFFFWLPTFSFLVKNGKLPSTWWDEIKGMGKWRKWPFPLFAATLPSYVQFSFCHSLLTLFSILSLHVVLGKINWWDCTMKKSFHAEKWEEGISQASTASGKNPGLEIWTGTFWTLDTTVLIPQSPTERQMFCLFSTPLWSQSQCPIREIRQLSQSFSTIKLSSWWHKASGWLCTTAVTYTA